MDIVKARINVMENLIEIIPEDGVQDNSIYEIRLKNIKDDKGHVFNSSYTLYTKLSPLFSDVKAVRSVIGDIANIDDQTILYHIREASKYAEYIKGEKIDENNIPFEVTQFTKYKAANECLLYYSINQSSSTGLSGSVGNVSFSEKESSNDLSKLLDYLNKEIAKWIDAIKGYGNEGRAKMKYAVKGYYKSSFNPPGFINPKVDFPRGVE